MRSPLPFDGQGVENAAEFKNAKRHAADLRSACREGKFEQACRSLAAIERLSEGNGNLQIDEPDDEGETALTLALINGHASIVDSLLEKGADSTHCANDNTPLPVVRFIIQIYQISDLHSHA
jgi:ankyrin repeat protein